MVQNVNPTFVKTPNWGATSITTGTGANVNTTVYTGGANGSKISGLFAVAFTTTAAFDVQWGVSSGSGQFFYGTASITQNSGTVSGSPTINMMSAAVSPGLPIDSDGNPFIFLPSSAYTLIARTAAASSAWAAGATIQIVAPSVGDF